jgi:hypothetical protein
VRGFALSTPDTSATVILLELELTRLPPLRRLDVLDQPERQTER